MIDNDQFTIFIPGSNSRSGGIPVQIMVKFEKAA